jgi:hypothetical protein
MNTDTTIEGAIAEVKPDTALVAFDPTEYTVTRFEPFKRQLASAKRAASKAVFDITTTAGMKQAKELRASFRTIRLAIETARKDIKAPIIEAGKKIEAVANELKAEVEPHEDKFDALVKAEEQRKEAEKQRLIELERARVEAIENRLALIRNAPGTLLKADSAALEQALAEWSTKRLEPGDYEEFLEGALTALNDTVDQLRAMLTEAQTREAAARQAEADRLELARLKAEQEERDRKAAAEAAERERKAQAERDAAAAEKAELQRQLDAMKAQLAASQPQPAAAPVEEEKPAPVLHATPQEDRTPINAQGQYYSTTTFKDNGKPILCNADGSRSVFCDLNDDIEEVPAISGRTPALPADWLAVEGFRSAVRTLRQTRTEDQVADILAEEFEAIGRG